MENGSSSSQGGSTSQRVEAEVYSQDNDRTPVTNSNRRPNPSYSSVKQSNTEATAGNGSTDQNGRPPDDIELTPQEDDSSGPENLNDRGNEERRPNHETHETPPTSPTRQPEDGNNQNGQDRNKDSNRKMSFCDHQFLLLLLAVIAGCLSSLIVSDTLIELTQYCKKNLRLPLAVKFLQCALYLLSIIIVICGLGTLKVGSKKWEMNWSFDTVVETLCPLLLGFFPIVLRAMTLFVRISCYSIKKLESVLDIVSDVEVPLLVFLTVAFLGIQELMGSTKFKKIRFRKLSLVTLGISLLVLWTDRIVVEVTERSPFHTIGECSAPETHEDCDAKEILDNISFMFTPLTIEFCIFSVVKIIELLNEYQDHNDTVKNDDSEVTDSSNDSRMMQAQDNQPTKNSKRTIISTCVFFFGAIVLIAAFVVFIFNATNAREKAKKTSTVSTDYTRDSDYLITNAMNKTDGSLSTAIDNYYILRLIAHLLNGICLIVLLISTACAKLQKVEPRLMSSYILMATGCAVVVFCGFSGFADVVCLANTTACNSLKISNHKSLLLEVFDYSVNVFELFLQIFALMQVQRKRLKGCLRKRHYLWHLPGIYLYLTLLNALLWGVDSFYEVKSSKERDLFDVQLLVYGEEHYNFIVQLLYPAAVYFRFHGAIIFARAFYEIVATDRLEVAHEQTLALDKEVDNPNQDIAQLRRILSDLKSYWMSPKVEKVIKMTSKDLPKLDKLIAQLQDSVRKKTTEGREENERLELQKDLDKLGKKLKEYMAEGNENA